MAVTLKQFEVAVLDYEYMKRYSFVQETKRTSVLSERKKIKP